MRSEQFLPRQLSKQRCPGITLRQRWGGERPFDADLRIIPAETELILRGINLGAFVVKQRGLADDGEAMGKPGWNIKLPLAVGREIHAVPLPEGAGAAPDVHRDVEDLALPDRDQFPLGQWILEMQSAQRTALGKGEIVLDERGADSRFAIPSFIPRFQEKSPMVTVNIRFDDQEAFQSAVDDLHRVRCVLNGNSVAAMTSPDSPRG